MTSERAVEALMPDEEAELRRAIAESNGPNDDVGNAVFGGPEDAEDTVARLLATLDAVRLATAPPPEPAIDVERLARAMDAVLPDYFIDAKPGNQVRAKAIAREYVLRGSE